MQNIDEAQWDIWEAGDYTGANAIFGEVRISKMVLQSQGVFRTLLFGASTPDVTVPNLQTINIQRSLAADAASMTFTFLNVIQPTAADNLDESHGASGPTRRQLGDYGFPGAYTYRRGVTTVSADKWGHPEDGLWSDMFIPNRVCKTYQGYGAGYLTGIWLIDSVEYSTNGQVTVQCRDAAKLLIEQRLYPPIIPVENYPLEFCVDHEETTFTTTTVQTTTGASQAIAGTLGANIAYQSPCNGPASIWDSSGGPYYGCNASVQGHTPAMAFDGNPATFWLSIGNSLPSAGYSFEWIQADCNRNPVNFVSVKPKYGGYKMYVSVMESEEGDPYKWQGSQVIPYDATHPASAPNGANIPYVTSVNMPVGENWVRVDLPRTYNAVAVRITFTNLAQTSYPFPYRAGVYEFYCRHKTAAIEAEAGTTVEEEITEEETTFFPGNITDYVDIVKVLAAWSGFFWPGGSADPLLADWGAESGRVWGDFQYSGAGPVDPPCIPPSFWDNKSVMDGINQIKEILGFISYIDATGGIVFRVPNIWSVGNYVTGVGYVGTGSVRDIDETKVLIDYGVTIDDANLRSQVTIVSAEDPTFYETVIPGYAADELSPETGEAQGRFGDLALLGGQQRIMLVPDYPFLTQEEVRKFAYLISLWIHWSYRKSSFRIPGIAALEPDDQVRIYERITSESYIHYIQSVNSSMNLATGEWYMDIGTHWLGESPTGDWVVNSTDIDPALFVYLRDAGVLDPDVLGDETLWPDNWWEEPLNDVVIEAPRDDDDLNELFPDPPPYVFPGNSDAGVDYEPVGGDGGTSGDPGGGAVYAGSNSFYANYWGPRCGSMTSFPILRASTVPGMTQDVYVNIDARSAPIWARVRGILAEEDVILYKDQTGAYNCRQIRDTGVWSVHAWGLAVDFNWLLNPYGVRITSSSYTGAGDFLTAMNRCVNEIRANGKQALRWGAGFSTGYDYMHLEVICTAADVAAGVTS